MLAQIWLGCKCGETWRVSIATTEDATTDTVYEVRYCDVCGAEVDKPKLEPDGTPHYHGLSEDELEEMASRFPDDDELDEDDNFGDGWE